MRIILFRTPEEKMAGLQHLPWVEDQTIYVFPEVYEGDTFHSQNVAEPFDIAFIDAVDRVLDVRRMHPPNDLVTAPEGSMTAIETKAGRCAIWGILPGTTFAL